MRAIFRFTFPYTNSPNYPDSSKLLQICVRNYSTALCGSEFHELLSTLWAWLAFCVFNVFLCSVQDISPLLANQNTLPKMRVG